MSVVDLIRGSGLDATKMPCQEAGRQKNRRKGWKASFVDSVVLDSPELRWSPTPIVGDDLAN
jgi:hypothetical protein